MQPSFEAFNLHPAVLQALVSMGMGAPTRVQSAAIPLVMDGRDAIVQAERGTGKTHCYVLPLLSLLDPGARPQALVLVPDRELTERVLGDFEQLGCSLSLRVAAAEVAESAADVVVGSPATVAELHAAGTLDLASVRILVLDEADALLEREGRAVEAILAAAGRREQLLVLASTVTAAVEAIARKTMTDPAVVRSVAPAPAEHFFARVPREGLFDGLLALLEYERPARAIVYTRNKWDAKRLAERLAKRTGREVGHLNGLLSKGARTAMIERFASGELTLLVATEVGVRGIAFEGVSHVVHHSVPEDYEALLAPGARAIALVTPETDAAYAPIRERHGAKAIALELPAAEPQARPETRPVQEEAHPRRARGLARPPRREPEPVRHEPAAAVEGERPSTGPLVPLPRHQTTWRKFRLELASGRVSRDTLHGWLADRTGVPRSSIRSIVIERDHATVEVEGRSIDRFLAVFGSASSS